jgi:hypothetical protein
MKRGESSLPLVACLLSRERLVSDAYVAMERLTDDTGTGLPPQLRADKKVEIVRTSRFYRAGAMQRI